MTSEWREDSVKRMRSTGAYLNKIDPDSRNAADEAILKNILTPSSLTKNPGDKKKPKTKETPHRQLITPEYLRQFF